jgi:hypothetical protein
LGVEVKPWRDELQPEIAKAAAPTRTATSQPEPPTRR